MFRQPHHQPFYQVSLDTDSSQAYTFKDDYFQDATNYSYKYGPEVRPISTRNFSYMENPISYSDLPHNSLALETHYQPCYYDDYMYEPIRESFYYEPNVLCSYDYRLSPESTYTNVYDDIPGRVQHPHHRQDDVGNFYEPSTNISSPCSCHICFPNVLQHVPSPSQSISSDQPCSDGESHYQESAIDVSSVMNGKNRRFTVMLRNVPNRYSESDIKNVLDLIIPNGYRVVNLPYDAKTHRNLGYVFITVHNNDILLTLFERMHDRIWPNSNNTKVCRVCHSIDKKSKKQH